MAVKPSTSTDSLPYRNLDNEGQNESFWLQMMTECQDNAPNKLPSEKSILVLGDDDAGKTQLIARLKGTGEKLRKGNGLEYHFINVRDEYCENATKLDVWILDEAPCYRRLLKYVLSADIISDTTVVLTASMSKPWNIFNSICVWIQFLEKHIENLNIPQEVLEEQKAKVLDKYRKYVEPTQSIYGSLEDQCSSEEIEHNLGLDIIVVVANTDYMTTLQSDFGYVDEHFDFIQLTLRKFCLSYGASLFYVSVKEDRNCDILLKYILHKVYGFPFRIPAMFLDRDSIFVPAGWDNESKIIALAESLTTIEFTSPFEDVIYQPSLLCDGSRFTTEIEAHNDQDFLHFIENALRQPLEVADPNTRDGSYTAAATQRNASRRVSRSPGVRSPQKKLETKLASGEGDTVLHTFFKSLLNRRTSAPVDRPIGISGSRGYNPSLGSLKSSYISLDSSSSSYENSESLAHGDKDSPDETNDFKKVDAPTEKSKEKESLPVVDELSSDRRKKASEYPRLPGDETVDPFTEFIKRYKTEHAEKTGGAKEEPSLENDDDDDKNVHQLPEYFMSSQSSGQCQSDCCYQNNSGDPAFDGFETVDRVTSKYNPPLRLLLENSHSSDPHISVQNGHDECVSRASSNSQKPSSATASKSSITNGKDSSTEDEIVPDLLKESILTKMDSQKESTSKENL